MLISSVQKISQCDSVGLQYLITHGIHVRTLAIYLQLPGAQLDAVEAMFLYGPAAKYLATYASDYPDHFLASQMPKQINERLTHALDMSPGRWAHASDAPTHDLFLARSLPRKALLSTSAPTSRLSMTVCIAPRVCEYGLKSR